MLPVAESTSPPRLDKEEERALRDALQSSGATEAYLFGSRTDPRRRGGDIDVLVLSKEPPFELSRRIATRFFMRCEEKIDVVVMNPEALSLEQQAFLDTLKPVRFA